MKSVDKWITDTRLFLSDYHIQNLFIRFQNQIERFEKLMGDMYEYLDSVAQASNAQPSAIEAQLGESVEALRDMEKMQPTLGHLDGVADEMKNFFSESYIKARFDWLKFF